MTILSFHPVKKKITISFEEIMAGINVENKNYFEVTKFKKMIIEAEKIHYTLLEIYISRNICDKNKRNRFY